MSKFEFAQTFESLVQKELLPFAKKAVNVLEDVAKRIVEGVAINIAVDKIETGNGSALPAAAKPVSVPSATQRGAAPETLPAGMTPAPTHDAHQLVGPGSTGAQVRELQRDLGVTVDGIDGPQTTAALKAFQRDHGLQPDGIAGSKTWPVLRAEPSLQEGARGDAVRRVQSQLGVTVDGIDGPQTTAAIKTFQKEHGLTVDGIVGSHTWKSLDAAAELAKAYAVPTSVPPTQTAAAGHAPPPTQSDPPNAKMPQAAPPPGVQPAPTFAPPGIEAPPAFPLPTIQNTPTFASPARAVVDGSAGWTPGSAVKLIYDAAVGGDISAMIDPKTPIVQKVAAGIDLVTTLGDPPKGVAEVALKLGLKAAVQVAEQAAGSATPPVHTPAAAADVRMHVRYAGESREMHEGYRQSGKILTVHDGIVTQSTGRATAQYTMSELTAGARDPAAIEQMLAPGNTVLIQVESHALHVTSIEQHHERDRTQGQTR